MPSSRSSRSQTSAPSSRARCDLARQRIGQPDRRFDPGSGHGNSRSADFCSPRRRLERPRRHGRANSSAALPSICCQCSTSWERRLRQPIAKAEAACASLSRHLTNLRSLVVAFGQEAGNFQQVTCTLPLPWQFKRLLNYARQVSTESARCIGDAKSVVSSLADILQQVNATQYVEL